MGGGRGPSGVLPPSASSPPAAAAPACTLTLYPPRSPDQSSGTLSSVPSSPPPAAAPPEVCLAPWGHLPDQSSLSSWGGLGAGVLPRPQPRPGGQSQTPPGLRPLSSGCAPLRRGTHPRPGPGLRRCESFCGPRDACAGASVRASGKERSVPALCRPGARIDWNQRA